MPKLPAGKENPVAGTFHCGDCGQQASVFVINKSRRRGTLYVRCGCGCDQRTGAHIQARWRDQMVAQPGFEWVKQGQPAPAVEPDPATDWQPGEPVRAVAVQVQQTEAAQVQEPSAEPNQVQQDDKRARMRQAIAKQYGGRV